MDWYKLVKTAEEIGHGDTHRGQFMKREQERLCKTVSKLRLIAAGGGPDDVLPRWRGEIRHAILLLPSVEAIKRMSMFELSSLSSHIEEIEGLAAKYSAKRFSEIMGYGSNDRDAK